MSAAIPLRAQATLEAIAARDSELRAFLSVDADGALAAATAAAARRATGERGPLLGVPVAIKDAYTTISPATTYGSRVDPDRLGLTEAVAVQRLRAAGAVIVGKTNMSELCIGEYVLRGAPRPPLTPERSPGASSGGCAVAVAAGLVPASVGSDTGGSVRTPAAYCGVVGFKPSYGVLPLEGSVALAPSLDHGGVLARDVATAVAVAEVLAGRSLATGPIARRVLVVGAGAARTPVIGRALELVERAAPPPGVTLAPAPPRPFAGWRDAFAVLMPAEAAETHARLIDDPLLGEAARTVYAAGAQFGADEVARARRARAALRARVDLALATDAVLICPAVDAVAPRDLAPRGSEDFWSEMDWHAPANLIGGPALTVPIAGAVPPVALQVVGLPGMDAAVIAAATWLESVLSPGYAGAGSGATPVS